MAEKIVVSPNVYGINVKTNAQSVIQSVSTLPGTPGADGNDGPESKFVKMRATRNFFTYDLSDGGDNGMLPLGQSSILTMEIYGGLANSVSWTYVGNNTADLSSYASESGSQNEVTDIDGDILAADDYVVITGTITESGTYLDTITLTKIPTGVDSLYATVQDLAVLLNADEAGVVSSFTPTYVNVEMYKGGVGLTYDITPTSGTIDDTEHVTRESQPVVRAQIGEGSAAAARLDGKSITISGSTYYDGSWTVTHDVDDWVILVGASQDGTGDSGTYTMTSEYPERGYFEIQTLTPVGCTVDSARVKPEIGLDAMSSNTATLTVTTRYRNMSGDLSSHTFKIIYAKALGGSIIDALASIPTSGDFIRIYSEQDSSNHSGNKVVHEIEVDIDGDPRSGELTNLNFFPYFYNNKGITFEYDDPAVINDFQLENILAEGCTITTTNDVTINISGTDYQMVEIQIDSVELDFARISCDVMCNLNGDGVTFVGHAYIDINKVYPTSKVSIVYDDVGGSGTNMSLTATPLQITAFDTTEIDIGPDLAANLGNDEIEVDQDDDYFITVDIEAGWAEGEDYIIEICKYASSVYTVIHQAELDPGAGSDQLQFRVNLNATKHTLDDADSVRVRLRTGSSGNDTLTVYYARLTVWNRLTG